MIKQKIMLCFFLLNSFGWMQWSSDPAQPLLIGEGIQPQVKSTSDGGVYITWITESNYHVYIQRLNSNGEFLFEESGLILSDNSNSSWIAINHLNLAVDSYDNAIVTTVDQRTGVWEVYAWKISSEGDLIWGEDGVAVTDYGLTNMSPRISVLTDNSIIVSCSHADSKIFIQRISSEGIMLWENGIFIEDETYAMISPQPVKSLENSFLVQWIGQASGWPIQSEIYLQKFSLDGEEVWSEITTVMESTVLPMGNFSQMLVLNQEGESFSAWTQFSGNVQNAVVHLISDQGIPIWDDEIDLSSNSSHFRMSPQVLITENSQDLISVWKETNGSQSQRGIFALRLDQSGNHIWNSEGVSILELNSEYEYLDISLVGFEEDGVIVFIEQSVTMNSDIFAKRISQDGNLNWENSAAVITNSQTAKSDLMIENNQNTVFISWSEGGFIYAHALREDGTLGPQEYEGCSPEEVELWSDCFSIESTTELDLSGQGLSGEIPLEIGELVNLNYINLRFNELSGSIPNSICSLTSLTTLSLSNNQLTGSIPSEIGNLVNLESLYLYNNELSGEIPVSIGNLENLTSLGLFENQLESIIPDNICNIYSSLSFLGIYSNNFCPPYPYCLTEENIGEQDISDCDPLKNDQTLNSDTFYLYDAYPNPFNPSTTIKYNLKRDALVTITVYDQIGRVVKVLVKEVEDAGINSVQWNGLNYKGEIISNGMYFFRIEAGTFDQTKKVILIK